MKKKIITIITIILIIAIPTSIYIAYYKGLIFKKEEKNTFEYMPLTYEICDSNSCIYLLGSIHVGDNRVTNFNKNLINYYNKSDYLAVELDINNVKMDLSEFISNESVDSILTEGQKQKLTDFLDNKSLIPYEQLKYFKLGYIYNYISTLPILELGMIESGVDSYFLSLAHDQNKEIIELETYEEQLSLLLYESNDFYLNQIDYAIDNYETEKESLKKLYNYYLLADRTNLEELLNDSDEPETEEERNYQNKMIYDRNEKMSSKVEEFLNEDKKVFMIVGLAHVIGEDGILDKLEEKNYKITLVK